MACVSPANLYWPPSYGVAQGGPSGPGGRPGETVIAAQFYRDGDSWGDAERNLLLRIEPLAEIDVAVPAEMHTVVLDETPAVVLPPTPVLPKAVVEPSLPQVDHAEKPLAPEGIAPSPRVANLAEDLRQAASAPPDQPTASPSHPGPDHIATANGLPDGAASPLPAADAAGTDNPSAPRLSRPASDRHAGGDGGGGGGAGGENHTASGVTSNPIPAYPPDALASGAGGVVLLRIWVRDNGTVESVKVHRSSGHASLDEAALATVRDKWQFVPARQNGVNVASPILLPIRFEPHRRS